MILSEAQEAALEQLKETNERVKQAYEDIDREAKQRKAGARLSLQVEVTKLAEGGVPLSRIGAALGTRDYRTVRNLIEERPAEPVALEKPAEAAVPPSEVEIPSPRATVTSSANGIITVHDTAGDKWEFTSIKAEGVHILNRHIRIGQGQKRDERKVTSEVVDLLKTNLGPVEYTFEVV